MHEIELKFQVPDDRRAEVDSAVAGRRPSPRTRLQASYCDTDDRRLAAAGLALRLRREGGRWVQTLKGAGVDGMTRFEHNVPRGSARAAPPLLPSLHSGTPVGDAMLARLQGDGPRRAGPERVSDETSENVKTLEPLPIYRTDILRRTRASRAAGGRVELAFDSGRIHAGDRSIALCELEIELLSGSPMAVIDTARRWLPRFGLWLDTRSKAERGDLLARGETMAPAKQARPVVLTREMNVESAWKAVLRSCFDQIATNASQVASGEHADEHVHQLRVGLRRLRSASSLFDGMIDVGMLDDNAKALFRQLGAARDRVVIEGEFAEALAAAMRSAGVPGDAPVVGPDSQAASPAEVIRETESQSLTLDLLTAMHAGHPTVDAGFKAFDTDSNAVHADSSAFEVESNEVEAVEAVEGRAPSLRDLLARRLKKWHGEIVREAKRFDRLDDASRHRLRKRAKRLRYAVEFSKALFHPREVRGYLRTLRALQERLGAITDTTMAIEAFARARDTDPRAMFALGWLASRREALVAAAAPALKAFRKVDVFWR